MRRTLMKSKIHRATVTQANLEYVGSITIDVDLMEAADLLPNEKVQIVDNDNGNRLETYVIPGERGSGVIGLNGAAARLVYPGDTVIIISYGDFEDAEARQHEPTVVFVDEDNRITTLGIEVAGVAEPTLKPGSPEHISVGSASTHGAGGGAGVAVPTPRAEPTIVGSPSAN